MKLIDEPKPRIVWCGLLTSTKRKKMIELIRNEGSKQKVLGIIDHTLQIEDTLKPSFEWKGIPEIKKEMDRLANECRDCGSPYEDKPFEDYCCYGKSQFFLFLKKVQVE